MRVHVRPAVPVDAGSLADLRIANAEAHLVLDPEVYRIPDREVVLRHFTAVLTGNGLGQAVLVSAGIHHRNDGAVRFYGRHGYVDSGLSMGRRLR